jgi:hypothetical protein
MLPSDCNLSTHEYVHHFITDPNTIRHFDWCLETIRELESELKSELNEAEINQIIIDDLVIDLDVLKSEYCEIQENYNELKSQYDTLLNSLIDVVDKFKD